MALAYFQGIEQILNVHNSALTASVELYSITKSYKNMKQDCTYEWFGLLHIDTNKPLDATLSGMEGALGSQDPTEQT